MHLAVPVFLLADVLTSALLHHTSFRSKIDDAAGAIAAIWLFAGVGLFLRSRNRAAFLRRASTSLISIYTIYVALAGAEGGIRLLGFTQPIPFTHTPWTRALTIQDPKETPGVSGPKLYTINALGLRGPMPLKDPGAYRIVTIGGSTTICTELGDSEEWAHLVMEKLNADQKVRPVWVGNAGVNGANSINHLVLMQWLPGVIHLDMVVFLFGVNDLSATLAFEGGPNQAELEKEAGFEELPPGTHWRTRRLYPLFQRLRLFMLTQNVAEKLKLRIRPPRDLHLDFKTRRERRWNAPVSPLPDLTIGLNEYAHRIRTLASRCRDLHIRCLFMTQPTIWRDDLTDAEKHLLWIGWYGRFFDIKGYVSAPDMGRAMNMFNQRMLDVCRQDDLECFDLAAYIPKNTTAFLDEMHFNVNGAQIVARALTQYLLARAPFNGQGR
jgi:lysophospholipase L1-like esterase